MKAISTRTGFINRVPATIVFDGNVKRLVDIAKPMTQEFKRVEFRRGAPVRPEKGKF